MTVDAPPAGGPAAAGRRLSLAQKFAIAFLGLVAAVLVINGAIDMIFTYREARTVAVRVQQEKADAAAERVVQFVTEIEQQLGWTTRAEWARVSLEQRRYDFIRLLRQAPAITELVHVDGMGREQLKLSRLEPDQVGSNADYSADPRFLQAVRDRIYYGPVTFRRGSEPYMTISMAHAGRNPGVTIADVNLKLAWDVVTAIRVGNTGYAFITDPAGRLIAHPDMSLVLRNTDLSSLPQVAAARNAGKDVPRASAGIGPDGREVLSAYAMVPKVGWNVFVELPASEALGPVWSALYQTLALLALGVVLAGVAGTLLARRMVVPITELQAGAQKLGEGDLTQRIPVRTGDEIGALAARFNIMAGRIQEEQENLERKVDERTTDLNEALARQTATSDILRVISGSPTDVTPVFDAIVEAAVRLLRTDLAFVMRTDGRTVTPVAGATPSGPIGTMVPGRLVDPDQHFPSRAIVSKSTLQFPDWSQIELPPHEQAIHERFGISSSLYLPLMRNDECLGVLTFACKLPREFDLQEVALAESFRDQAMIAIENTRLFNETKEALVHQTGTGKILQVIAASPTDIKPVLLTVVESACQLCDAYDCAILLRQGEYLLFSAHHGPIPIGLEKWPINRNWTAGRAVIDRETIHVHDLRGPEGEEFTDGREFSIRMGHRTIASVPLLREGESIGALVVRRREVHPFTDKQLALLRTFTDQAVIAINNVHLFDQVQAKTHDLTEALEQQTATAEVLKVISRSAFDLPAVLQALLESAARLCDASICILFRLDGDVLRAAATYGGSPAFVDFHQNNPLPLDRKSISGRAVADRRTIHVPDIELDTEFKLPQSTGLGGWRSIIGVPLLRDDEVLGVLALARPTKGPFNERQIELIETFADQAVIAIENARLFDEVQARTKEVTVALEYQTATSDVLNVISKSPNEVQPVFDAIVTTARRLCHADSAWVLVLKDGKYHLAASNGAGDPVFDANLAANPLSPDRGSITGRVALEGRTVHIRNVAEDAELKFGISGDGTRIGVPMLRDGGVSGVIVLRRHASAPFSDREIGLVETFAEQAVIAVGNARLFEQVQARTQELSQSLEDLRSAQDRLVQTEKLASLGQLTAGVAHEIKNPLNFVNNFADLSVDLVGEIEEALDTAGEALDPKIRAEIDEISGMLKGNLTKIVQHGRRADSIVKNMLAHSRESGGEQRLVDLNATVDEALSLAYHGARAEKPGFNITLERKYDPAAGQIGIYPQEFTRVLLNLVGNGFHAANKKRVDGAGAAFEPTLRVTTKAYPNKVKIKVRDNGTGMPEDVKARIFEPFFTTKPTGEGTGLGLSLSHDIIVKQHGGSIAVATQPGEFTEFTITLPRTAASQEASP